MKRRVLTLEEFNQLQSDPDFIRDWENPALPRPIITNAPKPLKPPGWESTDLRKDLERVAEILTKLDSDEAKEEIARDQYGTLRPLMLAAKRQLDDMLTVEQPQNLITIQN